jgi:hypothetical protein
MTCLAMLDFLYHLKVFDLNSSTQLITEIICNTINLINEKLKFGIRNSYTFAPRNWLVRLRRIIKRESCLTQELSP